MIPPDCRPGDFHKIMDTVAIDARSHRIDGTEYIEYSIPNASKVKYTPPSPTTSGYSESGSEMDNHDSGRASELEGSPKVPPKRPDNIPLGIDFFERIGSSGSTSREFVEAKTKKNCLLGQQHTVRSEDLPIGVVAVQASTLHSLVSSLENTRMRLDHMERNMDALVKAVTLQNKVSNEAVFKLTRTLLALGTDVKNFRETHASEKPSASPGTLYSASREIPDITQSLQSVSQTRKASQKSDYEHSTYPNSLHNHQLSLPHSVAPSSGLSFESYDNVLSDETASGADELTSRLVKHNHNDATTTSSLVDESTGYAVPRVPLYARVQKVKSVENIVSDHSREGERPPTLPRRSTELLSSTNDEALGIEKLMSELQLPTGSAKLGDDCSNAESLTRISRFSDVESLMSAFEDDENNLFSDDEFETDNSDEEDFDVGTPREVIAVSPDQGISSAADLSQSADTCGTASPTEKSHHSPTVLGRDAEEYSSSIIIPSKSMTSIGGSEKEGGIWHSKTSPLRGKKANALLANYKKIFKRKKKRAESQTSFTFVTSPLYEKELEQNPPKPNKKLIKGLSVESVISSKKFNASNLSLVSSSRDDNADSERCNSSLNLSPCKGSPRALITKSKANTQLLRLQSHEAAAANTWDNSMHDSITIVTDDPESYDNFVPTEGVLYTSPNTAEINTKIPNGNIVHEKAAVTSRSSKLDAPSRGSITGAENNEAFGDGIFVTPGVILDKLQREQADRIRFEQGEPPPKPTRPGYPKGSPRSSINQQNANGGVPGYRGMPAVPPKQKVFTPEELANHEAQEKLRLKQMEDSLFQQRLNQQQKEAEENEKWLQQEERNLNPDPISGSVRRPRGSSGSLSDIAPPPPSVAPSKPPRKLSKPRDEQPHGPPQTKLEEVKTAPTMQLNRDNDEVYKNTMEVVKAVLGMNSMTMEAKAEELFNSVKNVGVALKKLCACLEKVLPELPEDFHREIDMAQRTTNKDLSQVINQLKLVQRFYATTQVVEYKKCLMAANQVLAIDAKNLLDVVDRARIRKIQTAQEKEKAHASDIRRGAPEVEQAAAYEPEDVYPDEDFL